MGQEPNQYELGKILGSLTTSIETLTSSVNTLFSKVDAMDKRINKGDVRTAKISTKQALAFGVISTLFGGLGAEVVLTFFKK